MNLFCRQGNQDRNRDNNKDRHWQDNQNQDNSNSQCRYNTCYQERRREKETHHCTGASSSCWILAKEFSSMDIKWRDQSWFAVTWWLGVFKDSIGLRVGCGRKYCLDSVGLKEFLKLNAGEFGSFVMKTDKGSWVVTEPGAIEGANHGAAFFIRNNNQLEQVSPRINHS